MRISSETSNPGISMIFYPYFPTGERILFPKFLKVLLPKENVLTI